MNNTKHSELYFLPAAHGDAFIIHCYKGESEGFIVLDGGPFNNPRLNPFINVVEKIPKIDLMILTHQDNDHLIGIKAYVQKHKDDQPFPVERLWVNSARFIDVVEGGNMTAGDASKMADMLRTITKTSPVIWTESVCQGFKTDDISYADIQILSPTQDLLTFFLGEYENEMKTEEAKILNLAANRREKDLKISLESLSDREKVNPNSCKPKELVNMASIALILECDGLKLLMLGDSYPQMVESYLRNEGYSENYKLKVDYVKVSHHGSRNNISNSLLDIIDCQNYLISTNGGSLNSYHPDRETLANILCHKERKREDTVHLFFNHKLDIIEQRVGPLFNEAEQKEYNFEIHQPNGEWPINLRYN